MVLPTADSKVEVIVPLQSFNESSLGLYTPPGGGWFLETILRLPEQKIVKLTFLKESKRIVLHD